MTWCELRVHQGTVVGKETILFIGAATTVRTLVKVGGPLH